MLYLAADASAGSAAESEKQQCAGCPTANFENERMRHQHELERRLRNTRWAAGRKSQGKTTTANNFFWKLWKPKSSLVSSQCFVSKSWNLGTTDVRGAPSKQSRQGLWNTCRTAAFEALISWQIKSKVVFVVVRAGWNIPSWVIAWTCLWGT